MNGIVNFVCETLEVGLIDLDTLSRVVLINAAMKMVFGRNSYSAERFIIEVTLPLNGLKGIIDHDHEFYQVWDLYNQKKYSAIVFDMDIIPLNMQNVIRRRLFKDDIEDVVAGPNAKEPNILSVFQKQSER